MCYRQFGGITGDIAGYLVQLCELTTLIGITAGLLIERAVFLNEALLLEAVFKENLHMRQSISPLPIVADGSTCTQEKILQCDILDHLHLYIRRLLEQPIPENEIEKQIDSLCKNNPSIYIVCNELGKRGCTNGGI